MICDEFERQLEEYVEGALQGVSAQAMRSHAAACAACASKLGRAEALERATRLLPRAITPERDLWPGIAAELPMGGRMIASRGWRAAVLPLAAALALTSAAGFVYLRGKEPANVPAPAQSSNAEFDRAREELLALFEERLDEMEPELRAVVQQNLQVIEGAVAEIKLALEDRPRDPDLMQLLVATQQKELDLLAALVRLPDPV